jgi:hypothetical protein
MMFAEVMQQIGLEKGNECICLKNWKKLGMKVQIFSFNSTKLISSHKGLLWTNL